MSLDVKKKKLELQRVELAKEELLFKIEERLEEIERLKKHIEVQDQTILKLKEEIKEKNNGF